MLQYSFSNDNWQNAIGRQETIKQYGPNMLYWGYINAEVCQLINFIIQEADEEVAVCEMTGMVGQLSIVYRIPTKMLTDLKLGIDRKRYIQWSKANRTFALETEQAHL